VENVEGQNTKIENVPVKKEVINKMKANQREKALVELIEDSKKLGFNGVLIEEYEKQLEEVRKEIQELKDKRKKFREEVKNEKNNPVL